MKILRFIPIVLAISAVFFVAANERTEHGKFFEISKNIEIFTNLYKELNTYYVDDLDPSKLMRTGVDAMLNSLDLTQTTFRNRILKAIATSPKADTMA
ncbi:MAG: hypothetical protein HC817_10610 [Saprospiraceae bacterium]|nr:hypothetical protein [Saprospiraceae bacterium]